MIDLTTLIAYIVIVLGFVFIPGPATLLTVARATSFLSTAFCPPVIDSQLGSMVFPDGGTFGTPQTGAN